MFPGFAEATTLIISFFFAEPSINTLFLQIQHDQESGWILRAQHWVRLARCWRSQPWCRTTPRWAKVLLIIVEHFQFCCHSFCLRCSTSSKPAGAPQARSGEVEGSSSCCSRTRGAGADLGEQRSGWAGRGEARCSQQTEDRGSAELQGNPNGNAGASISALDSRVLTIFHRLVKPTRR